MVCLSSKEIPFMGNLSFPACALLKLTLCQPFTHSCSCVVQICGCLVAQVFSQFESITPYAKQEALRRIRAVYLPVGMQ